MKKSFALILCCLLIAALLCGCADKADTDTNTDATKANTQQAESATEPAGDSGDVDLSAYKTPAEVVSIDMDAADPSSDAMRFEYDDEGKVTQCYYNIGDQEIFISYLYKEGNTVQIYGFFGDSGIVAADETITLPGAYDKNKGFSEINGYYFKGF